MERDSQPEPVGAVGAIFLVGYVGVACLKTPPQGGLKTTYVPELYLVDIAEQ